MLAHFVGAECRDHGQARTSLLAAAGTCDLGGGGRAGGATRTARARRLVLVGLGHRRARNRYAELRLGLVFTEALLGLLLGLSLGLLVVAATLVFVALAGFRRLALGALRGLAHLADFRLFLGDHALLGV